MSSGEALMKTKFIQTRIDEKQYRKLKTLADAEERSLGSLIRIIIKKYMEKRKR